MPNSGNFNIYVLSISDFHSIMHQIFNVSCNCLSYIRFHSNFDVQRGKNFPELGTDFLHPRTRFAKNVRTQISEHFSHQHTYMLHAILMKLLFDN